MTGGPCPVCGTAHAACGAGTTARYIVDIPPDVRRRPAMAELFLYEVPHRNYTTIIKLSEADAEQQYGDLAKKIRPAAPGVVPPTPTQPWAVDPDAPAVEDDSDDEVAEKKAPAARNKARTTTSKA